MVAGLAVVRVFVGRLGGHVEDIETLLQVRERVQAAGARHEEGDVGNGLLDLRHHMFVPPVGHGGPDEGVHIELVLAHQGKVAAADMHADQRPVLVAGKGVANHVDQVGSQLHAPRRRQVVLLQQVPRPVVCAHVDVAVRRCAMQPVARVAEQLQAVEPAEQAATAHPCTDDVQGVEIAPVDAHLMAEVVGNHEGHGQRLQPRAEADVFGDEHSSHVLALGMRPIR